MVQIKSGDPHGLHSIQVQLTGSTGRSYGQAGSSLAAGSTSHAYLVKHPKQAEVQLPDGTVVDFTGGDRWSGSYLYGITSLGSFPFSISNVDANLIALTTGTSVDQTTNAAWTIYGENVLFKDRPQCSLIITYRLQSRESGTFGQNYYGHLIIPRCWINPKATSGAPNFQAAGTYNYQVVPTASDVLPNGVAFGTNQNFEDNQAAIFGLVTSNPIGMSVHIASGASATITVGYKPLTTAVGTSSNSTNWVAVNGTAGVADSVNTTTKAVAVGTSTTVATNDYIAVIYETNFRN